ncbi:hypothetical protein K2173_015414 [Erythroxylum novogranatense]|uniref:Uncharacterized protein n=1 Tax=Erythroxylum novogranatense TaxID=1862640 RepID=A0AAV8SRK5_9ROSI|nr:hypothetical protein K2173_015414 [Erythroxylum novogranatense]
MVIGLNFACFCRFTFMETLLDTTADIGMVVCSIFEYAVVETALLAQSSLLGLLLMMRFQPHDGIMLTDLVTTDKRFPLSELNEVRKTVEDNQDGGETNDGDSDNDDSDDDDDDNDGEDNEGEDDEDDEGNNDDIDDDGSAKSGDEDDDDDGEDDDDEDEDEDDEDDEDDEEDEEEEAQPPTKKKK